MFKRKPNKPVPAPEPVGFPETAPADPVPSYAEPAHPAAGYEAAPVASVQPFRSPHAMSHRNVLSSDVEIKGDLRFRNELVIDGRIEGRIDSEGDLTVGENALVQGEIRTKSVTIQGKVYGNVTVDERCELQGQAQLLGDLAATRLIIQDGATFVGRSEVNPAGVAAPVASTPADDEDSVANITSFTAR